MTKKFRIWDKTQNKFTNPTISYTDGKWYSFGHVFLLEEKGLVMQQWTGLFDKDGREIYEGDITSFDVFEPHDNALDHITNAEVWWDSWYLCWNFGRFENKSFSPPFNYSYDLSSAIKRDSFLVTGNIFETPELLK